MAGPREVRVCIDRVVPDEYQPARAAAERAAQARISEMVDRADSALSGRPAGHADEASAGGDQEMAQRREGACRFLEGLAALEAHQLDRTYQHWPAAIAAPNASTNPWHPSGPVVVAYGPGVASGGASVAIAALDGWTDSIPSRRHTTAAAFGFNSPKSRAPQAVLLAVPPDLTQRLDNAGLLDVVLETRELAHARVPPQLSLSTLPYPTSTALVSARAPRNFLEGWPA